MASLYKRASPTQKMLLRIVSGAVKNAADAHPEIQVSPQFRRSIAKRAVGTLTAQWPEVLARGSHPASDGSGIVQDSRPSGSLVPSHRADGSSKVVKAILRRAFQINKRPPFARLIKEVSCQIRPLKDAGEHERAQAMIDVLKLIHRLTYE